MKLTAEVEAGEAVDAEEEVEAEAVPPAKPEAERIGQQGMIRLLSCCCNRGGN